MNVIGLTVFQGINGVGVISVPNAQEGNILLDIMIVAQTNNIIGTPGTRVDPTFISKHVIEGGKVMQINGNDLTGQTFIALIAAP